MQVLIVGSGGREHALAWKTLQSPEVDCVWVAPGNAGTALEPNIKNIDINPTDINTLLSFAKENHIDLTIVGPEGPLSAGLVDTFSNNNLACFGPTQRAAQLESSKKFCKTFMIENCIPTASYQSFSDAEKAIHYVEKQSLPVVIKADGLAQGKGVIIAHTMDDAITAIQSMLTNHTFGEAGNHIIIEEFLTGEELSFIVISDGKQVLPLASSQDHKCRDNGDLGPNTGGMGAYSPAPLLTPELEKKIMSTIIMPTIQGLQKQNIPYVGFLYAGLMITPDGEPKVLEFNCRLGDPETQPILFRLKSNLVALCQAALHGKLNETSVVWDENPALCVVMASGGYPHQYEKGLEIQGLNQALNNSHCKVFHAGTMLKDHKVITNGGRVLGVTTLGKTLQQAFDRAYATANKIHWTNHFYRTDIGYRALKTTSSSTTSS